MKILKLVAAIGVSFLAAGIGSLATTPNIPTWYADLAKPFFNPPNWVFGPVWSILYLLMGISLYLVLTTEPHDSKNRAYWWFSAQLVLNALWSIVFFGLHQTCLAVGVIIALIFSIAMYMRATYHISKVAAYIMVPYVLWVCFATCLNVAIALLN